MECPDCESWVTCPCCGDVSDTQSNLSSMLNDPGYKCGTCKQRYEREIHELKRAVAEQKSTYELALKNLDERLRFLSIQDPDYSKGPLKEDVTFLVREKGDFVDDDNEFFIYAHRLVLADKSPIFGEMFTSVSPESDSEVIDLTYLSSDHQIVRAVVKYCYTADIKFTDKVCPQEVLKIADELEIFLLRDRCGEELASRIDKTNVAEMLSLSKSYDVKRLEEASTNYVKEHFDEVFPSFVEDMIRLSLSDRLLIFD